MVAVFLYHPFSRKSVTNRFLGVGPFRAMLPGVEDASNGETENA